MQLASMVSNETRNPFLPSVILCSEAYIIFFIQILNGSTLYSSGAYDNRLIIQFFIHQV